MSLQQQETGFLDHSEHSVQSESGQLQTYLLRISSDFTVH